MNPLTANTKLSINKKPPESYDSDGFSPSVINSNYVYWNLYCAFEIGQVFFNLFKIKRSLPVMAILVGQKFLHGFCSCDINTEINKIQI